MWMWKHSREPRPNVRQHPLDAHLMQDRLRGGKREDECPEAVIAWVLGAAVAWAMVLLLVWMVES